MIDENIMEKIIPIPDEDEEMEKVQGELEDEGFPITNFKKGGIFYHLCRMLVTIYIELKELARVIVNSCFIRHAEGDWLKIKAADYSKQQKEAKAAKGYVTIYRNEYNNALQVTKGHCFKTEPDAGGKELKFYCCENTVIDAGEPVGRVLVEAEAPGTFYNIAPGRISISMIHLDGMDYVTNEEDWLFEEGAEEEDLEDLRDRCMSSWAELATRTIEEKLRNAAKSVPGVLDARIDAQHPRGQGTVDVIVTGAAGEASPELIRKVGDAIEPLKGNYEDYLVKSSEVVRQAFELVVYLAEDAATEGVDAQAEKLIEEMMALTRGEMNTLYRDSIIQALSTKIDNYRKTDILQPSEDMVLEQDKVIMAGDITVAVRNVAQSPRGKE
ncbi:baseplate J/gp47 family protein [Lachnospiraceae bacterium 66-29]